jgi:hypothetical protein
MLGLIVLANFVLPRCNFTVGQLLETISWVVFPTVGACFGLIWGLETAARKASVPATVCNRLDASMVVPPDQ